MSQIAKTFAFHKPSPDGLVKITELRQAFSDLQAKIEQLAPATRERSVALTNLETTAMWAIKAVVCNDPNSVVEEPPKPPTDFMIPGVRVDTGEEVWIGRGVTTDRNDPGLNEKLPDGQNKKHIVLSPEERLKGFVRPVRDKYQHMKCGVVTTMPPAIAETYARNPQFYGSTFCYGCKAYLPVGELGDFVWDGTDEKVGT